MEDKQHIEEKPETAFIWRLREQKSRKLAHNLCFSDQSDLSHKVTGLEPKNLLEWSG